MEPEADRLARQALQLQNRALAVRYVCSAVLTVKLVFAEKIKLVILTGSWCRNENQEQFSRSLRNCTLTHFGQLSHSKLLTASSGCCCRKAKCTDLALSMKIVCRAVSSSSGAARGRPCCTTPMWLGERPTRMQSASAAQWLNPGLP